MTSYELYHFIRVGRRVRLLISTTAPDRTGGTYCLAWIPVLAKEVRGVRQQLLTRGAYETRDSEVRS